MLSLPCKQNSRLVIFKFILLIGAVVVLLLIYCSGSLDNDCVRGGWTRSNNLNLSHFMKVAGVKLQPDLDTLQSTLIFVSSSASNLHQRRDIRRSWSATASLWNMSVIFHVGSSSDDADDVLDDLLIQEHESHGDILQNNLYDTYENLTCKTHFC